MSEQANNRPATDGWAEPHLYWLAAHLPERLAELEAEKEHAVGPIEVMQIVAGQEEIQRLANLLYLRLESSRAKLLCQLSTNLEG